MAMTLDELRTLAQSAYERADVEAALLLCERIAGEGVNIPSTGPERVVYRTVKAGRPAGPVTMPSKYEGRCRKCNGRISPGEQIVWNGKRMTYHAACFAMPGGQ